MLGPTAPGPSKDVARFTSEVIVDPLARSLSISFPASPFKTNFCFSDAKEKISPAGYTIKPEGKVPKDAGLRYTPKDLTEMGFKPITWDGKSDKPITMEDGSIFIVLLHAPEDKKYVENAEICFQQIRQLAPRAPHEGPHRRGDYPILNMGILHGGGTQKPVLLSHGSPDLFKLEKAILESPEIMKHAGHPSAGLDLWIPELGVLFRKTICSIIENSDDIIEPNFYNSSFPACTVNFGPQVVTDKHCDDQNYATAVCSVQSLGKYDYKKGGHLIFWPLRLFVEFPPNTAIIFPSALLTHSNVPIQEGEERVSLVQYAPAELFRYVENGFMTDKQWNAKHTGEEKQLRNEERATNHDLHYYMSECLAVLSARGRCQRLIIVGVGLSGVIKLEEQEFYTGTVHLRKSWGFNNQERVHCGQFLLRHRWKTNEVAQPGVKFQKTLYSSSGKQDESSVTKKGEKVTVNSEVVFSERVVELWMRYEFTSYVTLYRAC
ncbi:hypothetical protein NP233_g7391 [Leucocoprinus birnbaumii]|uniref:Prolyl 4-hydroxylase alpha subunit domain-containing protein n=1 Tax=Leucocoprinus birnbaumii TaxID=56174 RepID=A0AAD5YSU3_9AGAR|nr:hypothetical protein NP233_g7391 [Leucocoprinus birnbaumii]